MIFGQNVMLLIIDMLISIHGMWKHVVFIFSFLFLFFWVFLAQYLSDLI